MGVWLDYTLHIEGHLKYLDKTISIHEDQNQYLGQTYFTKAALLSVSVRGYG